MDGLIRYLMKPAVRRLWMYLRGVPKRLKGVGGHWLASLLASVTYTRPDRYVTNLHRHLAFLLMLTNANSSASRA